MSYKPKYSITTFIRISLHHLSEHVGINNHQELTIKINCILSYLQNFFEEFLSLAIYSLMKQKNQNYEALIRN